MAQSISPSGRTESQIEADLGATRDRLADSLAGLVDTVHPVRIKQRTVGRIKDGVQARLEDARAYFYNVRGELRTDRVLPLAGGLAGVVTLLVVVRIVRGGRRSR